MALVKDLKSYLIGVQKKNVADRRPDDARLQGDQERDAGNWEKAVTLYREHLNAVPMDFPIWVQLGNCLKEAGDLFGAEEAYRSAMGLSPDDDLYLQIGHLEKRRNNLPSARIHYKKAVDLNPNNINAQREYQALKEIAGPPADGALAPAASVEASIAGGTIAAGRRADIAPDTGAGYPGAYGPRPLNAWELRLAGDRARDARLWREAAPSYRAYLERVPSDTAIWVQLGNCLKEAGDLTGGEAAYRRALAVNPAESDVHLQLGHVLKLQGKTREAIEAYRRSFALKPLYAAAVELQRFDLSLAEELAPQRPAARAPIIFFEISDLFSDMIGSPTVSGIQRVQLGLIAHIVDQHKRKESLDCRLVSWQDDDLWEFEDNSLGVFIKIYETAETSDSALRRNLVSEAFDSAVLVQPIVDDILVSTGSVYWRPNIVETDARLKRAGVRLGAYIYDFIPLTHPEFCERGLIDPFSRAMAEALLHYDFILTISEHVGREARRLMADAGYPTIPIRAVPLAHSLSTRLDVIEDTWTSTIAPLKGSDFVLCTSTLSSHKNQALLLQIWQLLIRDGIEPPTLVLVGRRGMNSADLVSQLATSNNLDGRVKVLEGLADSELSTLYRNCLFTMFPSFVEGWGLPIGESLTYGKVCVASDTTSLPEVGGDFVLYIDPYNARGAASLVRRLLDDRAGLQRLEARIRDEFRPRSWDEHGRAFLVVVRELGRPAQFDENRPRPIPMPFGKVVRPFRIQDVWRYGTRLPPRQIVAEQTLQELVLGQGWYPLESWGTWMHGSQARIGFVVEGKPGSTVRVLLQFQAAPWAQGNRLAVRASCGATTTVPLLESSRTGEAYPLFLAWLDCTADKSGQIELSFELLGGLPDPWSGETRRYWVGLVRLLCLRGSEVNDVLPQGRLVRPTALTGAMGVPICAYGTASLIAALQRRTMLIDGWSEPEAWGAWMTGREARVAFATEVAPGEKVRVALELRASQGWQSTITVRSQCGASARQRVSDRDPHDFHLWLDCHVGPDGRVELVLEAASERASATADAQISPLGITGLAYGRQGRVEDRLALAEALLFPEPAEGDEATRAALETGLRFSVIGHINGTYSLAAVNRRLALALETATPGTVRIDQVEGHALHDLSQVPAAERAPVATLAAREWHEEGPAVQIAQHWPVWVPPHPADLKLASVAWEESLVPLDMVRLLNEKFQGILVWTRSVAKALTDSGVHLPVRVMGYAPNLDAYMALGAERAAAPTLRSLTTGEPFTFLHVSSCFPRKGVDALVEAYAKAFRRTDPVRLVIKGFPNPHNDVPEQIAQLRGRDPEAPEIVMINRDFPAKELVALYAAADAMVLPTRGEGFNIPAAEAMAAGVPLIVTGYSGQTDFAGPDVARQIDYRFAPSRSHLQSYGSVWADPDVSDLAAAMREIFDAAGDPEAAREVAARVDRGRRAATPLGDGAAWASRVRNIAVDLLLQAPKRETAPPKVAWVTTWNIRCGIATHSRYLLDHYSDASRDVIVLCDERTSPEDFRVPGQPEARVAWRWQDPKAADRLAQEIAATGARAVVIQHQPGLIWPEPLTRLLRDDRLAGREIILILHNLRDLVACEHWERLLEAFRGVSRILVQSLRDLNELKSWGVVDNAALMPHGALRATVERHPARDLHRSVAPVLGTYGFLVPNKGFDVLIEALASIRDEWPAASLRMVTAIYSPEESATELARCRALAQSLGLMAAIEWHTDYLKDDDSLALLNSCDLLILPHRDRPESASGAARIAMASRVPVLVTPAEIFDEMGDAVIRAGGMGWKALAAATASALRAPKLRDDAVNEAERWLEAHDWTRMSERLYGMICGLARNR